MYKELNEKRFTTTKPGNETNNQQQADVTTSRFGPYYDKVHLDTSPASHILFGNGDGRSGEHPRHGFRAVTTATQTDYFAGKEIRDV